METTSDDASVTVGLVGITVIVEPVAPAGGLARVMAVAEGVAAAAVDVGEAAGGVILGEPYRDAEVPPEVAVVGSPAPTVGVYAGNVDGSSPAPLCEQPATLNDSAATMTSEKSRDFGTGTPGGRRDNGQSGDHHIPGSFPTTEKIRVIHNPDETVRTNAPPNGRSGRHRGNRRRQA